MLDYHPPEFSLRSRLQRRRRKRFIRSVWLILMLAVAGFAMYRLVNGFMIFNSSVNQNVPANQVIKPSLKNTVEKSLENVNGTYGIVIRNLKTGETYLANEHQVFEAGSLYKLWVMATVYQQIQNGKLTEDQVLSEDVAILNNKFHIDPDMAEQTEGTITLTVRDALNQMITISHNYAALLLAEKIKLSSVAIFLKENNLTESAIGLSGGSPTSTPFDIALFLEKLYKGEFSNLEYTEKMINLLKEQKLNDGLPKYLPEGSKIAHKTGDIGWFKHDAGIVFTGNGDYTIVAMSESNLPSGAQERIALLSKAVFDYLSQPK